MNQDSKNTIYIGPRGEHYTNEKESERAWKNYNYHAQTYIGPNGEHYMNEKESEQAWENYNKNISSKRNR